MVDRCPGGKIAGTGTGNPELPKYPVPIVPWGGPRCGPMWIALTTCFLVDFDSSGKDNDVSRLVQKSLQYYSDSIF